jgi:hypothetical protein
MDSALEERKGKQRASQEQIDASKKRRPLEDEDDSTRAKAQKHVHNDDTQRLRCCGATLSGTAAAATENAVARHQPSAVEPKFVERYTPPHPTTDEAGGADAGDGEIAAVGGGSAADTASASIEASSTDGELEVNGAMTAHIFPEDREVLHQLSEAGLSDHLDGRVNLGFGDLSEAIIVVMMNVPEIPEDGVFLKNNGGLFQGKRCSAWWFVVFQHLVYALALQLPFPEFFEESTHVQAASFLLRCLSPLVATIQLCPYYIRAQRTSEDAKSIRTKIAKFLSTHSFESTQAALRRTKESAVLVLKTSQWDALLKDMPNETMTPRSLQARCLFSGACRSSVQSTAEPCNVCDLHCALLHRGATRLRSVLESC